MTFEDFNSLLIHIEGVLNSRPLTPLSLDPNDLNPLTPSHLLLGRNPTFIEEILFESVNHNRFSNFQRIQSLKEDYWKRWSKAYVHEAMQLSKPPRGK